MYTNLDAKHTMSPFVSPSFNYLSQLPSLSLPPSLSLSLSPFPGPLFSITEKEIDWPNQNTTKLQSEVLRVYTNIETQLF